LSDCTVKWQLWNDIDLAVSEIVEMDGLKDVVYYDGTFELRIDATGGMPVRGIGRHKYAPYRWTLRKVK